MIIKPVRIQLSRKKGFRLQDHSRAINGLSAVNVARPSHWGNPFTVSGALDSGYAKDKIIGARLCVTAYRGWLSGSSEYTLPVNPPSSDDIKAQLAGKNLACWCAIGTPCHADILLKIANGDDE